MQENSDGRASMQVNMFEAKSQLSKLVKAALEGEEVIIASNGKPVVKLVPLGTKGKLGGWGRLRDFVGEVDAAFAPEVDAEIARMLEGDA